MKRNNNRVDIRVFIHSIVHKRRADLIHRIAAEAGISMVQLAMRWLLSTGKVDSIITGFTSLEQLQQNITAIEGGALSSDVMAKCDQVWEKLSGNRFQYNR